MVSACPALTAPPLRAVLVDTYVSPHTASHALIRAEFANAPVILRAPPLFAAELIHRHAAAELPFPPTLQLAVGQIPRSLERALQDLLGARGKRVRVLMSDTNHIDAQTVEELERWSPKDWMRRTGYIDSKSTAIMLREGVDVAVEREVPAFAFAERYGFSWFDTRTRSRSSELDDATTRWRLTPRERDILALVARGDANKAIAKKLGCATSTVEIHVSSILNKAGVESRAQVVAKFWTRDEP